MREIKFRAWDEKRKKFVTDFVLSPDGYVMSATSPNFYYDGLHETKTSLSQFTGSKDIDGNEIYEGDVIELVNDANKTIRVLCEYGIARRFVMTGGLGTEVDIPCFYFKLPNGKKSFPIVNNYAGKHDLELFEVIGNIYSNPELLIQNY